MKKELLRQIIHLSGISIIFLGMFFDPITLIVICVAMVLIGEFIFRIDQYHDVPLFSNMLGRCKRQNDERGFIYYFLGIIITLYLFKFNMAIVNAALIFLFLGDSASTIFGKRYGKTPIPFRENKSVEGSIAFLIVGFVGALTQLPLLPAFFGALSGAVTEAYSPMDDNIPIPVISGIIMSLALYFIY